MGEYFFWFWPTRVVQNKGTLNGHVCTCVCSMMHILYTVRTQLTQMAEEIHGNKQQTRANLLMACDHLMSFEEVKVLELSSCELSFVLQMLFFQLPDCSFTCCRHENLQAHSCRMHNAHRLSTRDSIMIQSAFISKFASLHLGFFFYNLEQHLCGDVPLVSTGCNL